MNSVFTFKTTGPEDTEALGEALGRWLEPGDWVGLNGDLGAGKTCLVRGLAAGMQVPPECPVTSPTFTLMNVYDGRFPVYHLDLYRLTSEDDLEAIGYYDLFVDEGAVLVEWSERIQSSAPTHFMHLLLTQLSEEERSLRLSLHGDSTQRGEDIKRSLEKWFVSAA